ncbi:hypothetical protein Hanom_Chr09g00802071 [Helianthus anomalus]
MRSYWFAIKSSFDVICNTIHTNLAESFQSSIDLSRFMLYQSYFPLIRTFFYHQSFY